MVNDMAEGTFFQNVGLNDMFRTDFKDQSINAIINR